MVMREALSLRPLSGKINPMPRLVIDMANDQADRDFQKILDGILGEEFLRNATEQNDLSKVTELRIQVNSSYQSLLDLNSILPNLTILVLDQSIIMSIRDLGVGLRQLVTLSLNTCGLFDLDGIGVLTGLSHLSLCDNSISDVAPLAMHENIQVLLLKLFFTLLRNSTCMIFNPLPLHQSHIRCELLSNKQPLPLSVSS